MITVFMRIFDPSELDKLQKRLETPDNGQVTIIGGSDLFHGAPILSLKACSRVVDMVYFSSPEPSVGKVAENLKSRLSSFIWVPWEEVGEYIKKSDAVLIGPGMKRYRSEKDTDRDIEGIFDKDGTQTKFITEKFLREFPEKKWVVDGGALQTMDARWIPEGAILTPNYKEFQILFKIKIQNAKFKIAVQNSKLRELVSKKAREHKCVIVLKGPVTYVCSPEECVEVHGGNNGLTKGGTGDVLAGLTVGLAAKNEPFLSACCAAWIVKKAADYLYERVGTVYNSDDLTEEIRLVLGKYLK
ncbi:MAG: NAD(P)H-hydrate dehydratase [Candidatus Blackburnbacteria bacterium]|nr:NAD(P)H-hydrate dehydratase [Candidatus Blackburnbacteria bacterium]